MSPRTSRIQIAFRALLISIILFNALVPTAALAKSGQAPDLESASAGANMPEAASEQKPLFFDAPNITYPQQTSPEPDELKSPVPTKDEVEFELVADPAIVPADGLVNFKVSIRNHSGQALSGLTFTDALETGFEYMEDKTSPVAFDDKTQAVSLGIDKLGAGETYSFSYSLGLTSSKRSETEGKLWLHEVELNSGDGSLSLTASTTIGVEVPGTTAQSEITALQPEGGWTALGRLNVYMEKDNVGDGSIIISSPAKIDGKGPELQFTLDVYETSPIATDALGKAEEQTINLTKEYTGAFKEPAYLEINLDDYIDLKNIPAGQEPYVATYDEINEIWVKVPILEQDAEKNSVTVMAAHFSTWGAGLGSSLPQNGANVLLFDQPYTSLFTGAARYSIPIWTPPGRAGMQPDLSLSYSSSTVDGVLGDVQAPWVGVGWNMDGVEIVRKITTSDTGYGYENNFALTINGTLYDLLVNPDDQKHYFTKRSSFLYIERHNFALGNERDRNDVSPNLHNPNGANYNPTGEWWEVVTTDGTRYRLGWNADSQQLALMYGYSCSTDGDRCTTPDDPYTISGYAGLADDLVAMRWRVDLVEDKYENSMSYKYDEDPPTSDLIPQFDRASYLESISYTDHPELDSSAPRYLVELVYGDRPGDVPTEFNVWDNVDDKVLSSIQVCYTNCIENEHNIIRTYDFGYTVQNVPNSNGTLTLNELQISGGNFAASGVFPTSPTSLTSPKIKFTYENKPNRAQVEARISSLTRA